MGPKLNGRQVYPEASVSPTSVHCQIECFILAIVIEHQDRDDFHVGDEKTEMKSKEIQ